MQESSKGLASAVAAFFLWGILPLYLKALAPASPVEILCHRIVWSVLTTLILLLLSRKIEELFSIFRNRKQLLMVLVTSALISLNWLTYIWAVNNNFIVEASLGYYINPLVNILLGMIFLQERLRSGQWLAVFFAFLGVCYLTFFYGQFPWISLVLAISFAFYGLFRKISPLPSLEGLCLETTFLSVPAMVILFFLAVQGSSDFIQQDASGRLLLMGTGIITSLPLLLFGFAAHRIPLSTLGIVQYLAPTLQLCLGVFVYKEPFPGKQLIGFVLVWLGLLIYASEGIMARLAQRKACSST